MPVIINGSTGISGTDGSAGTPAVQGTDNNTGMFFPAADTIAFAEGGVEAMRLDASGNLGVGTSSPSARFAINGGAGTSQTRFQVNTAQVEEIATNAAVNAYADRVTDAAQHIWKVTSTERARITAAGEFQFNNGYGSVATAFGCRAWVRFNGQANPASIIGSGGVSSITELANGVYRVNWSFTFPDGNYAVTFAMGDISGVGDEHAIVTNYFTASVQINTSLSGDTWADASDVCVVAFR